MTTGKRPRDFVLEALQREGWLITSDPCLPPPLTEADLEGELDDLPIAAERDDEKIALGLSSIGKLSRLDDFHFPIGQRALYRSLMARSDRDRRFVLAFPEVEFADVTREPIVEHALDGLVLPIALYRPEERRFVRWVD